MREWSIPEGECVHSRAPSLEGRCYRGLDCYHKMELAPCLEGLWTLPHCCYPPSASPRAFQPSLRSQQWDMSPEPWLQLSVVSFTSPPGNCCHWSFIDCLGTRLILTSDLQGSRVTQHVEKLRHWAVCPSLESQPLGTGSFPWSWESLLPRFS